MIYLPLVCSKWLEIGETQGAMTTASVSLLSPSTVCVNTGNMNTADLFLSMVNKITVKFVLSNLGKKVIK